MRAVACRHGDGARSGESSSATIDARLFTIDPATGRRIPPFGEQGSVDLRRGLRVPPTGFADYAVTSPPAVVGDAVVVGSAVADGTAKPHPSGEERAFHAVTGDLLWSWDPVPQQPNAVGAGSWASGVGGANAWSVIAADLSRNLAYVPTSSPSHDYFGDERLGDNLFSDTVVALRADTGERVWHFQTVHHDLWTTPWHRRPSSSTGAATGVIVPAIAIASKTGHVFVLDRRSGQPLIPSRSGRCPRATWPAKSPRRRSRFRPHLRRWHAPGCARTRRRARRMRTARGAARRSRRSGTTVCSRRPLYKARWYFPATLAGSRGAAWRTIA